MIRMLAWKELREHRLIWLTMVVMTPILGTGLGSIVGMTSPRDAELVSGLMILGMAAVYGVVCGAMMLAGEHEGGTMVFLDVFWGRRGLLWGSKFLLGVVFVLLQAMAVALALTYLNQAPPSWGLRFVGQGTIDPRARFAVARLTTSAWLRILPVVALEAYAWGLLGSAIARRVLPAAGIALLGMFPVGMLLFAPPPVAFVGSILVAGIVLIVSCVLFLGQQPEVVLETALPQELSESRDRLSALWDEFSYALERDTTRGDPRRQVLELWDEIKHAERSRARMRGKRVAATEPVREAVRDGWGPSDWPDPARPRAERPEAKSAGEVLWWLTFQQALGLVPILAPVAFVVGFFVLADGQVLWPIATLLLGVACGVAAFAPEQRDLSCQFLAAQHLPLRSVWRFKTAFWLVTAALLALIVDLGALAGVMGRAFLQRGLQGPGVDLVAFHVGSLRDIMGPLLFYAIWLAYGFAAGQLLVWYCRKNIFAVLAGTLVAAAALGAWLPSFLCGGMNAWTVWLPPLVMLGAGYCLVRAWAGGRITERRPLVALAGFALIVVTWLAVNFGYRVWEIPDAGEPLDVAAFRASLPAGNANLAGRKIQQACALFRQQDRNQPWLGQIKDLPSLPLGVIDLPSADGQLPPESWPICLNMADSLRDLWAHEPNPSRAFDYMVKALALSRNLRNKASQNSYVAGIEAERMVLTDLDALLSHAKPKPELLKTMLDQLNRHAAQTPPALDWLKTECFRSGGVVARPHMWAFGSPPGQGTTDHRWLVSTVALSMQTPWEAERKTRLWRLTWAGLLRGVQEPFWEAPWARDMATVENTTARRITVGWEGAGDGPDGGVTTEQVARWLDNSWLADNRLFASMADVYFKALAARCRMDAARQAVALALFQADTGAPPRALAQLVPKYFPDGLPADPYSGGPFHYRVSAGERIEGIGEVRPGQGIIWSTGPDRIDDGGKKQGMEKPAFGVGETPTGFDLITVVPSWP